MIGMFSGGGYKGKLILFVMSLNLIVFYYDYMSQLTIKIHWYGPYGEADLDDLDGGNGLYMFTGKRKHQRGEPEIQYFGITKNTYKGRFKNHHKLSEITRDIGIWLGEVSYPNDHVRDHLETAESILVYFWQPELNERKKFTPPLPTTVISHWFSADGKPRIYQNYIYKNLPDVLCWDGVHWRIGNLKVYENEI
jgi:hypothetical protein